MFDARDIDFETLEAGPGDALDAGSAMGRGFAAAGTIVSVRDGAAVERFRTQAEKAPSPAPASAAWRK